MPSYGELLGTPTWREHLVDARNRLLASPWKFALPAVPVGAMAMAAAFFAMTPSVTHYDAGDGAQAITLADGSAVRLSPASRLDFQIAKGRRMASLTGEAQFSVAHDTRHPFLVAVGDAQVRVVGTRFKLTHRSGCTQLAVLSGIVEMRSPSAAPRRLRAGEEAAHVDGGASYRTCGAGEGRGALRWSYIDVPLATVVDDMNRVSSRRIRISSPETARKRVTLSFAADEIDDMIDVLPEVVDSHIEYETSGGLVITPD